MFVIVKADNPLGLFAGYLQKEDQYIILDTDDCIAERYNGEEVFLFKDSIVIANLDKSNYISGVGDFKFYSLLKDEIKCSEAFDMHYGSWDRVVLESSLSSNTLGVKLLKKSVLFILNGDITFACLDFVSDITLFESYTVWAEKLGNCGVRLVQSIVIRMSDLFPNNTFYMYLYLLYKDGKFSVEKLAMAQKTSELSVITFKTDYRLSRGMLSRLSLMPVYYTDEKFI